MMDSYRSVQDRPIEVHVFGSGPKTVLVMAGVHGDETSGVGVVRSLVSDVSGLSDLSDRIVIMPLVNPDGYEAGTRQNANGIDINRNFPTKDFGARPRKKRFFGGKVAASEPETQAIMGVVKEYKPRLIISLHASLACVNYNGACVRMARRISRATGLPAKGDIGYPCPGSMGTYYGGEGRVPMITLELPKDGFEPSDYAKVLLQVLGI
ncbi:MAG TPA: M14 family zinc carboxypeptidase [Armatimonadota bacterium]|nr:M14 family zinc carboxypeptidase [Armatimonadota bacterium]